MISLIERNPDSRLQYIAYQQAKKHFSRKYSGSLCILAKRRVGTHMQWILYHRLYDTEILSDRNYFGPREIGRGWDKFQTNTSGQSCFTSL
jgi:hypothetical protein